MDEQYMQVEVLSLDDEEVPTVENTPKKEKKEENDKDEKAPDDKNKELYETVLTASLVEGQPSVLETSQIKGNKNIDQNNQKKDEKKTKKTGADQLEDFFKYQLRKAWQKLIQEADMMEGQQKDEEEKPCVINGLDIEGGLDQPDLSI